MRESGIHGEILKRRPIACIFIAVGYLLLVPFHPSWAGEQNAPVQAPPSTTEDTAAQPRSVREGNSSAADRHVVKLKVELVVVPVVVRDSAGRVVDDLGKGDFRIYDNRKLQDITQFAVEKFEQEPSVQAGGTALPGKFVAPGLFTALLFDDLHLDGETLPLVRNAALRRFSEQLSPTVRVGIFTTSGKVALDFTDDRAKLAEALNQLTVSPRPNSSITDCLNMTHEEANWILNRRDEDTKGALVTRAMRSCGIKDPVVAEKVVMETTERVLYMGDASTKQALEALVAVLRRLSTAPGQRSVVFISPGFLISDREHREYEVIDLAVRNHVMISSLDAGGLRGDSGDPEDSSPLGEFADGTGGSFYRNNNNLEAGIRRLSGFPELVYVLGFSPSNLKNDGAFHTIVVKLVGKGRFAAKWRQGYFAPKEAPGPAVSENREVSAAVFSRETLRGLPVEMRTHFVKDDKPVAKVTVMALVDLRELPHRESNGQNANQLRVVAAVFDRNGKYIGSIDRRVSVEWQKEKAAVQEVTSFDFTLDSGDYLVRLVVRDAESQSSFAQDSIMQIP